MWYWSLPGFGNSYHRSHLKATKLKYSLNVIISLSWGCDNIETIPDIVSLAAVHWSQATESKWLPYTTACVQFTCVHTSGGGIVTSRLLAETDFDWICLSVVDIGLTLIVIDVSDSILCLVLWIGGGGYLVGCAPRGVGDVIKGWPYLVTVTNPCRANM